MRHLKRTLCVCIVALVILSLGVYIFLRVFNRSHIRFLSGTASSFSELPIDLGPELKALPPVGTVSFEAYGSGHRFPSGISLMLTDNVEEEHVREIAAVLGADVLSEADEFGRKVLYFSGYTSNGHHIKGGWSERGGLCTLEVRSKYNIDIEKYNSMGGPLPPMPAIDPHPADDN